MWVEDILYTPLPLEIFSSYPYPVVVRKKLPGGVGEDPRRCLSGTFFFRCCVLALHYVLDTGSVMLTAIIMPQWFHVSISDMERDLLAPGMTSEDTLQ